MFTIALSVLIAGKISYDELLLQAIARKVSMKEERIREVLVCICYVCMICKRVECYCLLGRLCVCIEICLFCTLRSSCISIVLPILLRYSLSILIVFHSLGILCRGNTCTYHAFELPNVEVPNHWMMMVLLIFDCLGNSLLDF